MCLNTIQSTKSNDSFFTTNSCFTKPYREFQLFVELKQSEGVEWGDVIFALSSKPNRATPQIYGLTSESITKHETHIKQMSTDNMIYRSVSSAQC